MPKKHKPGSDRSASEPKSLEQLDREILRLLEQRASLLGREARGRQERRQSLVDASREKALWKVWHRELVEKGFQEKVVRTVFNAVNAMAYEHNEAKAERSFALRPQPGPMRIDLPGPADRLLTRMWLALAAVTGSRVRLAQAVHNDGAFELMKALNQVGASFSWDAEGFSHDGPCRLDFDKKSIFAGQDGLTFYLLVLAATSGPCSCKLTGSAELKLLSLDPLLHLAPALGARIVPLLPGGQGLPIRLEASGDVGDTLQLPAESPLELGLALAAVAPAFTAQPAIRILWDPAWRHGPEMRRALALLEPQAGAQPEEHGFTLATGRFELPESPGLPLDPLLAAYTLGLAALGGGQARLRGSFPDWLPEGRAAWALLQASGLDCGQTEEAVTARATSAGGCSASLDCASRPELYPLALALGLGCKLGTRIPAPSGEEAETGREILESLGFSAVRSGDELRLTGAAGDRRREVRLFGRDPFWVLGLALMALKREGIILKNPGDLTPLWPQFWSLYKGLPAPEPSLKQTASGKESGRAPTRRRRIVE